MSSLSYEWPKMKILEYDPAEGSRGLGLCPSPNHYNLGSAHWLHDHSLSVLPSVTPAFSPSHGALGLILGSSCCSFRVLAFVQRLPWLEPFPGPLGVGQRQSSRIHLLVWPH